MTQALSSPLSPDEIIARRRVLHTRLRTIEAKCAGWRVCTDGSYECALAAEGWYDTHAELAQLSNPKASS